jgi:anti-anti-sigma regulatory factor
MHAHFQWNINRLSDVMLLCAGRFRTGYQEKQMSPIRQIQAENHSTLIFSGRLVRGREADELLSRGVRLLATSDLWLDVSSATAVDGAGLGVLVALHNAARSSRRGLRLLSPSARVSSILRVACLDTVLDIRGEEPELAHRLFCCA